MEKVKERIFQGSDPAFTLPLIPKGEMVLKEKLMKALALCMALLLCLSGCVQQGAMADDRNPEAEEVVHAFFARLAERDYDGAYQLLSAGSRDKLSASTFAERFSSYLKLMEIQDIDVAISRCTSDALHSICTVSFVYRSQLGEDVSNFQQLELIKEDRVWRLTWTPAILHPDMADGDRIRARTVFADRGEIFAQGTLVAANVPGVTILLEPDNMEDPVASIRALSPLIAMEEKAIWEEYENAVLQAQVRVARLYLRDQPSTDERSNILLTLGMGEVVTVENEGRIVEPLPPVDDEINFVMSTPKPVESPPVGQLSEQEESLSQLQEGFYKVRYEARIVNAQLQGGGDEAEEATGGVADGQAGIQSLGTPVPVPSTPPPPQASHYPTASPAVEGEYPPPEPTVEPTEQPLMSPKPVESEEVLATEAKRLSAAAQDSASPTANPLQDGAEELPEDGQSAHLLEETDENGDRRVTVEGYIYAPYVRLRHSQDLVLLKSFRSDELDKNRLDAIRAIPGVRVDSGNYAKYRYYPYGEAMFHVLGYVSNINKEQLEEHRQLCAESGEDPVYTTVSQIGASGIEGQYEEELRGRNGYEVYLSDENGAVKAVLYQKPVEHGRDVHLSIDPGMQKWGYDLMRLYLTEDQSGSVVTTDPQTGAVLTMISYPSVDPNRIFTMPNDEWVYINTEDPGKPLYNRATRGMFTPGSIFKPFTAVMGLESGVISVNTVFPWMDEVEDNKWYPDKERWGWHWPHIARVEKITGTPDFRTALRDSDNIYFAWVAMLVGKEKFMAYCNEKLGFEETIPFDLPLARSSVFDPNRDKEQPEFHQRFLAESGYGQGQMFYTPIHAATIFGSFAADGDAMRPYIVESIRHSEGIEYVVDKVHQPEVWKKDIITDDYALKAVIEGLEETMAHGTGRNVKASYKLAGKTGTAQTIYVAEADRRREQSWLMAFKAEGEKNFLASVVIDCWEEEGGARFPILSSLFDYEANLSQRTGTNAEALPAEDIANYGERDVYQEGDIPAEESSGTASRSETGGSEDLPGMANEGDAWAESAWGNSGALPDMEEEMDVVG